jgi:hypothetical protein
MRRVSAALVHYPVLDRQGAVVTTAITNLDLHDIARSVHTYGLDKLYVVHPISAQRELAQRVKEHWTSGSGARRIPDRSPAIAGLEIVETLDDAVRALGPGAEVWTTSANPRGASLTHAEGRTRLAVEGPPVLIVFGTGWGLAEAVNARAQAQLAPIVSRRTDGYNHLSVRAAAAILFDRLLGNP